jgi:hypothetical protein
MALVAPAVAEVGVTQTVEVGSAVIRLVGKPAVLLPVLTSLAFYVRAEGLTYSDGSAVETWYDESGSAYDFTQGTAADRPIFKTAILDNDKPVLRFDGSGDCFELSGADQMSVNQPITYFFVMADDDADTDTRMLTDSQAAGSRIIVYRSTVWLMAAGIVLDTGDTNDSAWHIHTVTFNGASSTYHLDGTEISSGNAGAFGYGGVTGAQYLGADNAGARTWDGDVAEVVLYSAALSEANRNSVGLYLAEKYGLSWLQTISVAPATISLSAPAVQLNVTVPVAEGAIALVAPSITLLGVGTAAVDPATISLVAPATETAYEQTVELSAAATAVVAPAAAAIHRTAYVEPCVIALAAPAGQVNLTTTTGAGTIALVAPAASISITAAAEVGAATTALVGPAIALFHRTAPVAHGAIALVAPAVSIGGAQTVSTAQLIPLAAL